MTLEDLEPRPQRGAALTARARAAMEGKSSRKSAADALFNFRS
jgi:uncharacterized small protein (DUF1192 family)